LLDAWGLPDDPAGLERFSLTVVEALAGLVPIVKPQVAFFERHGSRGIAVLERVLLACRDAELLSIADAKRGDIGSTMAGYADAFLADGSPLAADALTVSPYLGFESLRPVLDLAAGTGRGVFVLALTSNPEGPEVQHARLADGRTVAQSILDAVAAENARVWSSAGVTAPVGGLGSVGVVVGATVGRRAAQGGTEHVPAHRLAVGGPILAPGIGAQGASAADLADVFGACLQDTLASSSREVLSGGPGIAGLRGAAERAMEELRVVLQSAVCTSERF
jgi:orotidine-5'-phosphate decarboxylase